MKKIRIGNDIRLAVDFGRYIKSDYVKESETYQPESQTFEQIDNDPFVDWSEVYHGQNQTDTTSPESSNTMPVSIRTVKAFLINSSRKKMYEDLRKKSRFVSRFPLEPYLEQFTSTQYDIRNSGYPTWRAYPITHALMPWKGFGVNPKWDQIYKALPAVNDTEYRASVSATDKQNIVNVSFPAKHQLHTGVYDLVLVAGLWAPGYNNKNIKTITVDIPGVFELVSNTAQSNDDEYFANVEQVVDNLPYEPSGIPNDIYVNNGAINNDGNLLLTRSDQTTVEIDLDNVSGWYDNEE